MQHVELVAATYLQQARLNAKSSLMGSIRDSLRLYGHDQQPEREGPRYRIRDLLMPLAPADEAIQQQLLAARDTTLLHSCYNGSQRDFLERLGVRSGASTVRSGVQQLGRGFSSGQLSTFAALHCMACS